MVNSEWFKNKIVAELVVVLMGEKGWSFSKVCGKSLVESSSVEWKTIVLVCYGSNSVRNLWISEA